MALFVLPGLHVNSSILVCVMYKIYKDGCQDNDTPEEWHFNFALAMFNELQHMFSYI